MKKAQPRPAVTASAYTVDEAAVYIGISRASLYRLLSSGQLAKTVVQGRTLVRKVDADALLARCSTAA